MLFTAACAMVEAGCGVAVVECLAAQYAASHGLISKPLNATSDLSLIAVWLPSKGLAAAPRKILAVLADTIKRDMQH